MTSAPGGRCLVTSGQHGVHGARVATALGVCRAAPQRLVFARVFRAQSAELQHPGGPSPPRHGLPGRPPERRLDPAANALASFPRSS